MLPHYDDITSIYKDVLDALLHASESALTTATQPITTPFGEIKGKTGSDVVLIAVETVGLFRYADISGSFDALRKMHHGGEHDCQKKVVEVARSLAKYDIAIWEKVGPTVQIELRDLISRLSPAARTHDKVIIGAICEELISPDIEGTTWSADSVSLQRGTVPAIPAIIEIRNDAISVLLDYFAESQSDSDRRSILLSLWRVGYVGAGPETSDTFLNLSLSNVAQVAHAILGKLATISYEQMQSIEHHYLYDYRRARDICSSDERKACHENAANVMSTIELLRDRINSNPFFSNFKVLVGFESVFPFQWNADPENNDEYQESENYRAARATEIIAEMNETNEVNFFELFKEIASIRSNDLATFPPFTKFLRNLSCAKPEVSRRLLEECFEQMSQFLPAILAGFMESGNVEIYEKQIEQILVDGKQLSSLARHLRMSDEPPENLLQRVLHRAIDLKDYVSVAEMLLIALEMKSHPTQFLEEIFEIAINFINGEKVFWWVRIPWRVSDSRFIRSLSFERATLLIPSLVHAESISYQVEQLMIQIAKHHPLLVWQCFADRLKLEDIAVDRYQAIPYQFHGLDKELSKDASAAVQFWRSEFEVDAELFRFRGGRLLHATFHEFSLDFANQLIPLILNGTKDDARFLLAILENFQGQEATHEVLKTVIVKYLNDDEIITSVVISLESTGVVMGELGFANALREKLRIVLEWQSDPRLEVRAFATKHASSLELRIADEQRRAEQRKALRELEYDLPERLVPSPAR